MKNVLIFLSFSLASAILVSIGMLSVATIADPIFWNSVAMEFGINADQETHMKFLLVFGLLSCSGSYIIQVFLASLSLGFIRRIHRPSVI